MSSFSFSENFSILIYFRNPLSQKQFVSKEHSRSTDSHSTARVKHNSSNEKESNVSPNFPGLHPGHVLPSVLAGSPPLLRESAGVEEAGGGGGVHPVDLGAGHVLRQREDGLLPQGDHGEPVLEDPAHRGDPPEYQVGIISPSN